MLHTINGLKSLQNHVHVHDETLYAVIPQAALVGHRAGSFGNQKLGMKNWNNNFG